MNRHQQRVSLLFGLLMISAALLGRAGLEAQTLAEHGAGAAHESDDGLVLTLGDVVFDAGKATLQSSAVTAIDRLVQLLNVYPERSVRIEGHTDSSMKGKVPMQAVRDLSLARAEAIKRALIDKYKFDPNKFSIEGKGWDTPADPASPNEHALNRRVEISVFPPEQK